MKEEPIQFSEEQIAFVLDLKHKAEEANKKTHEHFNCSFSLDDSYTWLRVDDVRLLYVAVRLLPNVFNYLVNVLPNLLYPFVIAYLQELSDDDQPITINELYDLIKSTDTTL